MSPNDEKLFKEFMAWKQSQAKPKVEKIVNQPKQEYNMLKEFPREWIPIIIIGGLAFFITTWPMLVLGMIVGAIITFYHLLTKWKNKS